MKKLTKIAAAIALTASAGAMALPPGFDANSDQITSDGDKSVSGSAGSTAVCSFVGNAQFDLSNFRIYDLGEGENGGYLAYVDGASIGEVTAAGHNTVNTSVAFNLANYKTFDDHDQIFKYVSINGTEFDSYTTPDQDYTLTSGDMDLTLNYVALHSTSGFQKVGDVPVTVTISCKTI